MNGDVLSQASHLHWAAELALRAPSVLNTQPWLWRVHPDRVDLWVDRRRQLSTIDPEGRLLTVSCGAALHHLRTGLAASGDEAIVRRLPDPATPDLLAQVSLRHPARPVASDTVLAQFAAIGRRRTDRRPFADMPVPQAALKRLRAAAEAEGTHLHVLDSEDVAVLAVAAERAAMVETSDPAYRDELRTWTAREPYAGDGVALDDDTPPVTPRRVPLRDFALAGAPLDATIPPADHAATYAILWGDQDDPMAWLRAGEALSAVMLEATVAGLAMSPMSDVIEVGGSRLTLRRLLAALGHPFLALRIGVPEADGGEHADGGEPAIGAGARTRRLPPRKLIDSPPRPAATGPSDMIEIWGSDDPEGAAFGPI